MTSREAKVRKKSSNQPRKQTRREGESKERKEKEKVKVKVKDSQCVLPDKSYEKI